MRSRLLTEPSPTPRLTITLSPKETGEPERKDSKGRPQGIGMGEAEATGGGLALPHKDLPFRMADMKLTKPFPDTVPFSDHLNAIRTEWQFQFRLLSAEWKKEHYMTLLFGMLALCLGSVSTELWSGGDAKISGIDGILAINGFQFFQVLVSVLFWAWFAFQTWTLFPVMRVHAISLLVMWNAMVGAQIFFHKNNASFPFGFKLSEMMEGTLIMLTVLFFLFFFWKAVVETRDLHVEVHHLHEDVRVMEAELAEHSLKGWTAIFGLWVFMITVSSWAGLHHVAEYGDSNYGYLVLHLLAGLPAVPLLMVVLWYPQRMLGNQAQVRTRAAVDAALEMEGETPQASSASACPDCGARSEVRRDKTGALAHPCQSEGCTVLVPIGTSCSSCKATMPNRLDCPSCGVNAPAIDFLPDQEAW